jgi:hypothetical protein
MLDDSEDGDGEVAYVGAYVTVKANHTYKPTGSLCTRGKKSRASCGVSTQTDK